MQKTITYNRETKDFDAYLSNEYIGSYSTHLDAENALNALAYEQLARQPDAYQVREQAPDARPEDRGRPVSYHPTFPEAVRAAQRLAARGRNVFVSAMEVA